jgi:hypothetical protein
MWADEVSSRTGDLMRSADRRLNLASEIKWFCPHDRSILARGWPGLHFQSKST